MALSAADMRVSPELSLASPVTSSRDSRRKRLHDESGLDQAQADHTDADAEVSGGNNNDSENKLWIDVDGDHGRPRADAAISQPAALTYWASVPATVDGMLGGFAAISRVDLQGSRNFLAKLRRRRFGSSSQPSSQSPSLQTTTQTTTQGSSSAAQDPWLGRAADLGAGIGRVTQGLLSHVARVTDLVEPVAKFAAEPQGGASFAGLRDSGRVGCVYVAGLEAWTPDAGRYDLLWHQWVLGQLTDAQLRDYLLRARQGLAQHGWAVVKENVCTADGGRDVFDDTDSSVTRGVESWRALFRDAGWRVVAEEMQRGLPRVLFPVYMWALQPVG